MKLSIVTTLYDSAPYLREFHERMSRVAGKITDDFEIILVNDGSPDNALALALGLYEEDPKVQVIDLSRNFGHHKAIMTGLAHANGEYIFLLDVDLEESPELLEMFWQEIHAAEDLDVVYGQQSSRKGTWVEKISGAIFYKTFNWFSQTKVPENLVTVRLMKKGYVDALVRFMEQELFLAGIWAITGFNQKPLTITKLHHSPTTYSFSKKTALIVDSITSFTNKPLMYIFYSGIIMMSSSFAYIIYLAYRKFSRNMPEGWTTMVASIWLVGGVVTFSLGVIGIYISKIFMEVKNRPYTIIKKHYARELNK